VVTHFLKIEDNFPFSRGVFAKSFRVKRVKVKAESRGIFIGQLLRATTGTKRWLQSVLDRISNARLLNFLHSLYLFKKKM
jgi:hypothetical protein